MCASARRGQGRRFGARRLRRRRARGLQIRCRARAARARHRPPRAARNRARSMRDWLARAEIVTAFLPPETDRPLLDAQRLLVGPTGCEVRAHRGRLNRNPFLTLSVERLLTVVSIETLF